MNKVFVDTSVLFAAIYSSSGSARDLIRLALLGKVSLHISQLVIEETERNLRKKAPEKLDIYQALMGSAAFTIVPDPGKDDVVAAYAYTALKDAPIIAAAIATGVDYVATYDRKDLLSQSQVAEKSGLKIVTPDVVVAAILAEDEDSDAEE